jgi:hypothetical protein
VHFDISVPDVVTLWKRVEALGGSRLQGFEEAVSWFWPIRRETSSVSCHPDRLSSTISAGPTISRERETYATRLNTSISLVSR